MRMDSIHFEEFVIDTMLNRCTKGPYIVERITFSFFLHRQGLACLHNPDVLYDLQKRIGHGIPRGFPLPNVVVNETV